MKNQLLKFLLATILLASYASVKAEDIDLYVSSPPGTADIPNVLIILDNTANWTSAFTNEMAALSSVVSGLPPDKFRLGLMMFSETGGSNSGNDGAYVRAAIRTMNSDNKTKYENLVNSLHVGNDKSNGGKIAKSMEEAYLYFSAGLPTPLPAGAGVPHAGNNKDKADYAGNTSGTAASKAVYALANNALLSKAGASYVSPIVGNCVKNYVIYISNGAAQDNNSDIAQATTALAGFGGNTTTIPISPSGSASNVADEWARFMNESPLSITTYTLDVDKVTTGQGPGWSALLKSVAGDTSRYFAVTSEGTQIADVLNGIFSNIQSVDSAFSSVSLPVSVNSQGLFLNRVFIGMFRPSSNASPRWHGNLKQYKLGIDGGALKLLDAGDNPAIDADSGFITECARSFWTGTVLDSYWSTSPKGNCPTPNSKISDTPDGDIVEKGAQAFKLRSIAPSDRNVKTCTPTDCTALTTFNNANVTQTMLGAADTAERDSLINWQIGQDLKDENINGVTAREMRPSSHGDVVHSRPVAINYGTDAAPNVVVFYGGNDGMLRAVNGNRSNVIDGIPAGGELWSFVAPEFYPKIKRIYDNTKIISFHGQVISDPPPAVLPSPKDYGVDGPITAYKNGNSAWIFASLRRGGRAIYAMDVSKPSSPVLKWKVGCLNQSNDADCTSGISDIGQTWSAPQVTKAAGYVSGASPLLIMGGGYDTCHDTDESTSSCNAASKGNKIYVLDANTGTLIKTFTTDASVVGDINVIKNPATGFIKYAYTADLAGNVYRISGDTPNNPIGTNVPNNWTITKIASLGGNGANKRKFMFRPNVVDDNGTYVVLLGSGDREKPLSTFTSAAAVQNRFYMIQDKLTDEWFSSENTTCGSDVLCENSLFPIISSATPTASELGAKKGWYLDLKDTEQVVTSAATVFNTVTFSTHQPTPPLANQCGSLGTATVYNLNFRNAATAVGNVRGESIKGGGLPPSPVVGQVILDNGTVEEVCFGCSNKSALEGGKPYSSGEAVRPKSRIYWKIKK